MIASVNWQLEARLHHLSLSSPDPQALATFYRRATGLVLKRVRSQIVGRANERRLIFRRGKKGGLGFAGFALVDENALGSLKRRLQLAGEQFESAGDTTFFKAGAILVSDPDGNKFLFGLPRQEHAPRWTEEASARPARLQHVVITSTAAGTLARFYQEVLGFRLSDSVVDKGGQLTTAFLRCSEEHHSLAVFQADESRLDHHCYEAGDWMLIRDWADHLAAEHIRIVWGPGRHGPGNNLFIFFCDPDGNWLEISAELETVTEDRMAGTWPHEERTLNSWGPGLLRTGAGS